MFMLSRQPSISIVPAIYHFKTQSMLPRHPYVGSHRLLSGGDKDKKHTWTWPEMKTRKPKQPQCVAGDAEREVVRAVLCAFCGLGIFVSLALAAVHWL